MKKRVHSELVIYCVHFYNFLILRILSLLNAPVHTHHWRNWNSLCFSDDILYVVFLHPNNKFTIGKICLAPNKDTLNIWHIIYFHSGWLQRHLQDQWCDDTSDYFHKVCYYHMYIFQKIILFSDSNYVTT